MTPQQAQAALDAIAAMKAVPRWQRQAEARLAREMGTLFDQASAAVLREMARRGIPSNDAARRVLVSPVEAAFNRMLEMAADATARTYDAGRNSMIAQLRAKGIEIGAVPELSEQITRMIRDKVFVASGRTMERLRGDVMDALSRAYSEGLGIRDAAQLIGDKFVSMRDFELERIARTEIHGAASDAAHSTIVEYGAEFEQWIAADDERTRESHAELNGQIVRTGARFSNGLAYPGDRSGPIDEWINCRCRIVPYIMPRGKQPPAGRAFFYESEIV